MITEVTFAQLIFVSRDKHPQVATRLQVPERFESIQMAIEAADHGDTVLIAPGEYTESIDFQAKSITVASMFILTTMREYIDSTIIRGEEDASVISFANGEDRLSRLCGVTVTGGVSGFGAGIYCGGGSSPTIDYCRITGNHAAGLGGGIIAWENSNPLLDHCEIFGNSSNSGAGIASRGGSKPILINCVITDNQAINDAGAIYCLSGGMPIIINTIIWNNYPEEILFKDTGVENNITLAYCILREGTNQIFVEDNGEADIRGGLLSGDPIFTDPDENQFNLEWNSPCIDEGTTLFVMDGDTLLSLGDNQFLGESSEIGAHEYDPNHTPERKDATVQEFALKSVYPNPVNGLVKIDFQLNKPAQTSITLYNQSGRFVAEIENSVLPAGDHIINCNLESFSTGSYILELQSSKIRDVKKMIILK